jgi:hypothetical protein
MTGLKPARPAGRVVATKETAKADFGDETEFGAVKSGEFRWWPAVLCGPSCAHFVA